MASFGTPILVVALALPGPRQESAEAPEILHNLDIMNVVLSRQIEASKEHIGAANEAMLRLALLSRYLQPGESDSVAVSSEYIPGIGALFTLSVAVRLEAVEAKNDPGDGGASEDLWEEVQQQLQVRTMLPVYVPIFSQDRSAIPGLFGASGEEQDKAPLAYHFSGDALSSLEDVLLGTLAEYGHRLGLPRGEKIIVAARLRASPEFVGTSVLGPDGNGVLGLSSNLYGDGPGSPQVEGPERLVVQVTAAEAQGYHEGSLTLEKLVRNARVDRL